MRAGLRGLAALAALAIGSTTGMSFDDGWDGQRRAMVAEVERMVAEVAPETGRSRLGPRVVAALLDVPRHEFVPAEERAAAYRNRPLSIGHGQTISQPFIVALMSDLLELRGDERVLEIGTGSGYQAAVLACLAREVYSIEIVAPLGREAAATLARLGYANVRARIGDGYAGWPDAAPFDAIIVTAAPDHIPPALVAQLKPGGRLVIPVGDLYQELLVITKAEDGSTTRRQVIPVRFVPFTREPAPGR